MLLDICVPLNVQPPTVPDVAFKTPPLGIKKNHPDIKNTHYERFEAVVSRYNTSNFATSIDILAGVCNDLPIVPKRSFSDIENPSVQGSSKKPSISGKKGH